MNPLITLTGHLITLTGQMPGIILNEQMPVIILKGANA